MDNKQIVDFDADIEDEREMESQKNIVDWEQFKIRIYEQCAVRFRIAVYNWCM